VGSDADPEFARAGGQELSSFIVVFDRDIPEAAPLAAQLAGQYGRQPSAVYEHALKGFAAELPATAAAALARHPSVAYVEPDLPMSIAAQTVPTGISRIFADGNSNLDIDGVDDVRIDVGVAIIDTGIDWEHPDLNVVDGINCASRKGCSGNGDDDHYHGTHVAGTVAALDNDFGVVGVAPGARLYAVKVLDRRGSGYTSWIVAGIDWVTARASEIQVANLSLGGSGSCSSAYQEAFDAAVGAGVAIAVAAGNSSANSANYSPASCTNILTVSALADFNGLPGGGASSTCRSDVDDTFANFSNYGAPVDIIAPGVCIYSTYPLESGSYASISGTSMASPHVAGGLALLASAQNTRNVAALYSALTAAGNSNWNNSDDGDSTKEPLLDVTGFQPRLVAVGGGNLPPTASIDDASCSGLTCSFSGSGSDDGTIASYAWDFGDGNTSSDQNPSHTYAAGGSYTVTLTVTDDGDATGSATTSVSVSDPNNAVPTASIDGSTCSELACDFSGSGSDTDGSIASYGWDFGDGNTSSDQNPSHTYAAGGTYTVTLTVTDNGGATGSATTSVTVTAPTSPISVTYSYGKAGKGINAVRINEFGGGTGVPGQLLLTRDGTPVIDQDPFVVQTIYETGEKGGATYVMTVCDDAGTCSLPITIVF
jgi:subtilisin family serine protease